MATKLKRVTFVVTPEIEVLLNEYKRKMFYDRTQSDMIRQLVLAGVRAIENETELNPELVQPVKS